jgi:hypothetical protein
MPAGRPPKYNNCIDFDAMVQMYFENCDGRMIVVSQRKDKDGNETPVWANVPEPYLISGLAQHLDLTLEGLSEYGRKPEFSAIVKKAKEKVSYGLQLMSIDQPQKATGCIFNLKCNHGFKEAQKIEHTGENGGPVKFQQIEYVDPRDEE